MALAQQAKNFLKSQSIRPSKGLGQSFMVDPNILERMTDYAHISHSDRVLEIGAGLGFLTEVLSKRASLTLAVELDLRLADHLRKKFISCPKVNVIQGDFMKIELGAFEKVVSNPPYARVSPLIFHLINKKFDRAVLTLQREFAERLVAKPGEDNYGRLSVMFYFRANAELLELVPASVFLPKPKISSFIVDIKPKPHHSRNWKTLEDIVRVMFSQRKRTLRKALKTWSRLRLSSRDVSSYVSQRLLDKRIFQLEPSQFEEISNSVQEISPFNSA
ncbi:MAG: 16S rRNA (adenine(1518)-N(6)/adenine(1519)-N(6))-dimethyltransferase RsmA [Candidatus Bathyarchaeia archaeon]